MAHTKGPWRVFATYNVQSKTGRTVANCNTLSSNGPDWEQIQSENQANAQLMAAAPDLLKALDELKEDPRVRRVLRAAELDKLDDLVSKARGEVSNG